MNILKGIVIGIGAILPGLSGGMLAASMNVYDKLIYALNKFTKTPIKAILSIWQYLLGIILGLVIGLLFIIFLYIKIPIPTTFLFLGIILSTLPEYIKLADIKTFKLKHLTTFIITTLLIVSTLFLTPKSNDVSTSYIILIIVGILIALSLIIPGLSGTMIMMALGFYKPLVLMFKDLLNALLSFNTTFIFNNIIYFIVLGISFILTLVLLAKLIVYLINNYKRIFDIAVLAIIFISPFTILYTLYLENNNIILNTPWYIYLISTLLLILGLFIGNKLNKKDLA